MTNNLPINSNDIFNTIGKNDNKNLKYQYEKINPKLYNKNSTQYDTSYQSINKKSGKETSKILNEKNKIKGENTTLKNSNIPETVSNNLKTQEEIKLGINMLTHNDEQLKNIPHVSQYDRVLASSKIPDDAVMSTKKQQPQKQQLQQQQSQKQTQTSTHHTLSSIIPDELSYYQLGSYQQQRYKDTNNLLLKQSQYINNTDSIQQLPYWGQDNTDIDKLSIETMTSRQKIQEWLRQMDFSENTQEKLKDMDGYDLQQLTKDDLNILIDSKDSIRLYNRLKSIRTLLNTLQNSPNTTNLVVNLNEKDKKAVMMTLLLFVKSMPSTVFSSLETNPAYNMDYFHSSKTACSNIDNGRPDTSDLFSPQSTLQSINTLQQHNIHNQYHCSYSGCINYTRYICDMKYCNNYICQLHSCKNIFTSKQYCKDCYENNSYLVLCKNEQDSHGCNIQ